MIATIFDKILLWGEVAVGVVFIIIIASLSTKDKDKE